MALSQSQDNGVFGQQEPNTPESGFNAVTFLVNQMLNKLSTVTLVKIIKVTNAGGVSSVGFVDVQPMVNQMTGDRKGKEHGIIHNIPYFRLQGGTDAIILDPKAGDIGMCGFCSRDISVVKRTKKIANAGSSRTFDWADGLYFGGVLNGAPTQYVRFSTAGIELVSPTKITMTAPIVEINAATSFTVTTVLATIVGDLMAQGKATITKLLTYLAGLAGTGTTGAPSSISGPLKSNGVNVGSDHAHGGITRGTQLSDGPQ